MLETGLDDADQSLGVGGDLKSNRVINKGSLKSVYLTKGEIDAGVPHYTPYIVTLIEVYGRRQL